MVVGHETRMTGPYEAFRINHTHGSAWLALPYIHNVREAVKGYDQSLEGQCKALGKAPGGGPRGRGRGPFGVRFLADGSRRTPRTVP